MLIDNSGSKIIVKGLKYVVSNEVHQYLFSTHEAFIEFAKDYHMNMYDGLSEECMCVQDAIEVMQLDFMLYIIE